MASTSPLYVRNADADTTDKLRIIARERGENLSDIVNKALKQYVDAIFRKRIR